MISKEIMKSSALASRGQLKVITIPIRIQKNIAKSIARKKQVDKKLPDGIIGREDLENSICCLELCAAANTVLCTNAASRY